MFIQQLSVFIENRPGMLAEVTDALAKGKIDITALSLADTAEFGILRLIVDQPQQAQDTLRQAGFVVKMTDVLAVAMDDSPGGLAGVVHTVTDAEISIEYMYAFVSKREGKAVVVMRVSDLDRALTTLKHDQKTLVTARDIYNL